ncbi:hypothetical protein COLU111180_20790 [Cohnella lubricantis]|uniref:Uncharacterized protein n=1 Tax=Cohnella lubricantis TaxID=2163172 RepID=A0A841T946_9BACL|nr:hypothetical protein [Cohnella lubricantis]MBB6677824.1 hypothetical protein [Cohnella lubricantis]MBP2120501.1 nitrogen fixation-related uncharacterized protein [Cohnella lubricantis]
MKKVIAGGILLFAGMALYLGIHIPAAEIASNLGGWSTPPGRLGTALQEVGGVAPTGYSIFLIVIGILILLWGAFDDEIKKLIKITAQYARTVQEARQTDNQNQNGRME